MGRSCKCIYNCMQLVTQLQLLNTTETLPIAKSVKGLFKARDQTETLSHFNFATRSTNYIFVVQYCL